MKGVHGKLNPGFPCEKQVSTIRRLFTSKLDLILRKKLVKCYIWRIALYSAETGTLQLEDCKYLGSFEMWCWRRVERIT